MKKVVRIARQGKGKGVSSLTQAGGRPVEEIDTTVALIQALIPLGLQAVAETLEAEVVALAGARYGRTSGRRGVVRWGQQPDSVYLADQKLPVPVPRVRDRVANREIPLTTYETVSFRIDVACASTREATVRHAHGPCSFFQPIQRDACDLRPIACGAGPPRGMCALGFVIHTISVV